MTADPDPPGFDVAPHFTPASGPRGVSVVVIAKNEADQIEACLESAAWADERVVLDTGSSDDTVARARAMGARVAVAERWPGFGRARQEAERLATRPWIFRLDADERVTPELAAAVREVVAADRRDAVYEMRQLNWCFGRFIRHSGWYPRWVPRLYPRGRAAWDDALVHEQLVLQPGLVRRRIAADLVHVSYDSLREYLEKSAMMAEAWADERERQGVPSSLAKGLGHGAFTFVKMYLLRLGLLDGRAGFLLALLSAHSTFAKYADLWLRTQPRHPPPLPPPTSAD
jgi:(heptosyl)LPS beta-1,4-glucosyltransferase